MRGLGSSPSRSIMETERATNCHDCKKPFPVLAPGHTGGTGRVWLSAQALGFTHGPDAEICYSCAFERDKASMKISDRHGAYLSSDGYRVTTWSGETLGTVIRVTPMRMFGRYRKLSIRVRAFDGSMWHARGASEGLCCTLRRMKGGKS